MTHASTLLRIGIVVLAVALTGAGCGRSPKPPESQPKAVNAPPDANFGERPPVDQPATAPPSNPSGVDWLLVTLNGNTIEPGGLGSQTGIRLDRSTKEAEGLAFCNRFKGKFDLDEAGLRFGPLTTTRKACRGVPMDLETKYLKALQDTSRWSLNGDRLVLSDAAGKPLLEYAARSAD